MLFAWTCWQFVIFLSYQFFFFSDFLGEHLWTQIGKGSSSFQDDRSSPSPSGFCSSSWGPSSRPCGKAKPPAAPKLCWASCGWAAIPTAKMKKNTGESWMSLQRYQMFNIVQSIWVVLNSRKSSKIHPFTNFAAGPCDELRVCYKYASWPAEIWEDTALNFNIINCCDLDTTWDVQHWFKMIKPP